MTSSPPPEPGGRSMLARPEPANLADVLERVLDKGIVIAGDIKINLVDVELLTIKVRLLVASVDRAREMGIDWWQHDPMLSSQAPKPELAGAPASEQGAADHAGEPEQGRPGKPGEPADEPSDQPRDRDGDSGD